MSATVTCPTQASPKYAAGVSRRDLPLQPPFTVDDLRNTIPAHCWERPLTKSFAYLAWDLLLVLVTGYLAYNYIEDPRVPSLLRIPLWGLYTFFQGIWGTGVWVIAHECGHRAFSSIDAVNDCVGLIFHSALLVPYHGWRISHASHHFNTGCMQKDEVHVPPLRAEVEKKLPWTVRQALSQFLKSVLLGWPAYLLWNASSNKSRKGRVNHFEPNSPLFKGSEKSQIILSDAALAVVIAILIYIGSQIGGAMLFKMYFLPYFHVNFWLVLITKLQHSEKNVPFWGQQEWTWLRGQLTTIDRSYGKFLDVAFHHIQDTHVCHHLFPKLPHYHAEEATAHLIKKLGPYYLRIEDNVIQQTYECFVDCAFVDDKEKPGVYWWDFKK